MNRDSALKEFQIYPWSREIEEGSKYLENGKTGGGIGETGSWGVESTKKLQDSTEEPRNHHQGVLGHPHGRS
jgi:hypothetical protein